MPEASHASASGRSAVAIVLAVVAALLLAFSVPALWLNRMVTDTDYYVSTVAPLADDPAIQDAVASAASLSIIERLDVANRIERILPGQLDIVAVPIAEAVNGFVERQAFGLVRSEGFSNTWESLNRTSHTALVAAVTGRDTGAVDVKAGELSLDVGDLADQLLDRLKAAGLDLMASLPDGATNRRIVLFRSPALASLTAAVDTVTRAAFWLPFLGLALAGAAMALATDRRKTVMWLGGALTLGAVLPLQALFFSQSYVTDQLYRLADIPTPAAQAAFDILFRDLVVADRAATVLGLVLWLGALIAGSARVTAALRPQGDGGLAGIVSRLAPGDVGEWVAARRPWLRWTGVALVLSAFAFLPAPRTLGILVVLTLVLAAWLAFIELVALAPSSRGDEVHAEPGP